MSKRENSDAEDHWDELDEASVRKNVKDLLRSVSWQGDTRMRAMHGIFSIVQDEIASAITPDIHGAIELHPKESAADCQRIVDEVSRALAPLHLALKDPRTNLPVRLKVAATPPTNPNESWLVAEPLICTGSSRPLRLPRPVYEIRFELVPIPTLDAPSPKRGRP